MATYEEVVQEIARQNIPDAEAVQLIERAQQAYKRGKYATSAPPATTLQPKVRDEKPLHSTRNVPQSYDFSEPTSLVGRLGQQYRNAGTFIKNQFGALGNMAHDILDPNVSTTAGMVDLATGAFETLAPEWLKGKAETPEEQTQRDRIKGAFREWYTSHGADPNKTAGENWENFASWLGQGGLPQLLMEGYGMAKGAGMRGVEGVRHVQAAPEAPKGIAPMPTGREILGSVVEDLTPDPVTMMRKSQGPAIKPEQVGMATDIAKERLATGASSTVEGKQAIIKRLDAVGKEIGSWIEQGTREDMKIPANKVYAQIDKLKSAVGRSEGELMEIRRAEKDFISRVFGVEAATDFGKKGIRPSGDIPIASAREIKTRLQEIHANAYDRLASGKDIPTMGRKTQLAEAAGLKEAIGDRIPEINPPNREYSTLNEALDVVARDLVFMEQNAIIPGNLLSDIVGDTVPFLMRKFRQIGDRNLIRHLKMRPDISSRLAVKINDLRNAAQGTSDLRPITKPSGLGPTEEAAAAKAFTERLTAALQMQPSEEGVAARGFEQPGDYTGASPLQGPGTGLPPEGLAANATPEVQAAAQATLRGNLAGSNKTPPNPPALGIEGVGKVPPAPIVNGPSRPLVRRVGGAEPEGLTPEQATQLTGNPEQPPALAELSAPMYAETKTNPEVPQPPPKPLVRKMQGQYTVGDILAGNKELFEGGFAWRVIDRTALEKDTFPRGGLVVADVKDGHLVHLNKRQAKGLTNFGSTK